MRDGKSMGIYHSLDDAKRIVANNKRTNKYSEFKIARKPRSKMAGPAGKLPEQGMEEGEHSQHYMDANEPNARDYADEKLADIRPMSFKQDPVQATTDRALKYGAKGVDKLRDLFREQDDSITEDEDKYSVLSGQYGHSGKMQKFDDVEEDVLARLKQLSGMLRSS
jgi:hypothetical protein